MFESLLVHRWRVDARGTCRDALLALCLAGMAVAGAGGLEVGKPLPEVALAGEQGGRLDGRPWSSEEVKGRLALVICAAPEKWHALEQLRDRMGGSGIRADLLYTAVVFRCPNPLLQRLTVSIGRRKTRGWTNTDLILDKTGVVNASWQTGQTAVTAILVAPDGNVLHLLNGGLPPEDMDQLVDAVGGYLCACGKARKREAPPTTAEE